jgi:hypothetical protein
VTPDDVRLAVSHLVDALGPLSAHNHGRSEGRALDHMREALRTKWTQFKRKLKSAKPTIVGTRNRIRRAVEHARDQCINEVARRDIIQAMMDHPDVFRACVVPAAYTLLRLASLLDTGPLRASMFVFNEVDAIVDALTADTALQNIVAAARLYQPAMNHLDMVARLAMVHQLVDLATFRGAQPLLQMVTWIMFLYVNPGADAGFRAFVANQLRPVLQAAGREEAVIKGEAAPVAPPPQSVTEEEAEKIAHDTETMVEELREKGLEVDDDLRMSEVTRDPQIEEADEDT